MGIWPEQYALGEKLFFANWRAVFTNYTDDSIYSKLRAVLASNNQTHMKQCQAQAELFLKMVREASSQGGLNAPANKPATFNALFGPVSRDKENLERIHALTRAAACVPGEYETHPDYNKEAEKDV